MNWEAIGAIAELIGALGVIATLGYLAVQIRHNTLSTRTSSYQSAISAASEWSRGIGLDPDATRIIVVGNSDYPSLSEEDKARFGFLTVSLLRNFENVFYQYRQGALDPTLWAGWSTRMLAFAAQPGFRIWWKDNRVGYAEEFVRFLESAPAAGPGTPPA